MSDDHKVTRQRSPNFPSYSLPKCLELAKRFYEKHRRSSVPFEVATKALGYSSKSSNGLQVVGALNAYGLIIVDGSGALKKLRLSDGAYKIIEDTRVKSPERDRAIEVAALTPNMFQKILDEYPDALPSEDHLAYELKFKHGFNPSAVQDFINAITATFDFAKIYNSDIIPEESTGSQELEPIRGNDMQKQISSGKTYIMQRTPEIPVVMSERSEHEIANYRVGRDLNVRLTSNGVITQKSILKLIKMLEMNVEDFPADDGAVEPTEIKSH